MSTADLADIVVGSKLTNYRIEQVQKVEKPLKT